MDDVCCCSLCGIEFVDGDSAYGFSSGVISSECYGFRMDENEWEIFCPDCRNTVDKLILEYQKSKLRSHHGKLPEEELPSR
jgi:hypothetical protein